MPNCDSCGKNAPKTVQCKNGCTLNACLSCHNICNHSSTFGAKCPKCGKNSAGAYVKQ